MDPKARILFVDDEQLLHSLFERLFARHGMTVTSCSSAHQAVELLANEHFDLVVTDFMMPDMDGFELLGHVRENYPRTRVIMITAHSNVQHAVRMMQHGAIDYIPKPFSTAELVERVQACLAQPLDVEEEEADGATPAKGRKSSRKRKVGKTAYIGEAPSIKRIKEVLPRISSNKAPVFIQGESGTGKEILSRTIHEMSDRSDKTYLTLNCANLPRELVESHLFGHRKGSFTGAIDDMTGAFERADGGTLLLDEITEVDLSVQAKLLRVLQESEFQKIGSTDVQKVDVRVIATSNRNLSTAISTGVFREDLYHRLAVFPLTVPPLRERLADVPLLADHFVKKYCALYDQEKKSLSRQLMERFRSYNWPGNVRELENLVQRGVLLSAERDVIEIEDVFDDFFTDADPARAEEGGSAGPKAETIDDMERYMILQALEDTGNNQQQAAQKLGISARTIRNKLKRYREEGLLEE
ncbi:MAG: sigma-54-dependent Fis family transcriptional regulator [Rhodothermales bacterium]|nr:sigma-54-dependent Fis family transcriptional regulator [Rhodothermales bacterium]MBO6780465.1 sigma-54-dependent Fis family transcriptional regulator [Rhodothermales bacterium]